MQQLHEDITLNFMLNRLSNAVDADELKSFATKIDSIESWVEHSLDAARNAEKAGRSNEAAYYYRGAEFFMTEDHPEKLEAFERFMSLYYEVHPDIAALRTTLPYGAGKLAIIDIPAIGEEKDVIVGCSGFDGLIEEMVPGMLELAESGYRCIIYEGPGQGSALRRSHLPMIYDWEKAVAVVLDHFQIDSCTLLGLSLGGYLAPRAAAFEPRVKRLIAWGPMYDFIDCFRPRMGEETFAGLISMIDAGEAGLINEILMTRMEDDSTAKWSMAHGMHTCGGHSPFDFLTWARTLNLKDVSHLIEQDTLIIAGTKDHLVPHEQVWQQAAALTNAHSVTVRICTEYEDASEHCQVTNTSLVIAEIVSWMDKLNQRDG
jgi:alpha-beta hydrolase superfamily lysophospholipase